MRHNECYKISLCEESIGREQKKHKKLTKNNEYWKDFQVKKTIRVTNARIKMFLYIEILFFHALRFLVHNLLENSLLCSWLVSIFISLYTHFFNLTVSLKFSLIIKLLFLMWIWICFALCLCQLWLFFAFLPFFIFTIITSRVIFNFLNLALA